MAREQLQDLLQPQIYPVYHEGKRRLRYGRRADRTLEKVRSMRVRYRRRALLDVENIYDYIKERNERAATEVVARIRYAVNRLGMWPHIGHRGRIEGTYEFLVLGLPYII